MAKPSSRNDRSSIYNQLFNSSKLGDIDHLKNIILSVSEAEAESMINDLSDADWRALAEAEEHKKKAKSQYRSIITIALTVIFIIALAILVFQYKDDINQKIYGTNTPVPTTTFTPTLKPKPSPTMTPTAVPPTPLPTTILDSAYLIKDPASIYPSLPAQSDGAWMLELVKTIMVPGIENTTVWNKEKSGDPGSKNREYAYSNQVGTQIHWQMDQPLPNDGIYGIYILDKMENSEGKFSFAIANDAGIQLVPFRGIGQVDFLEDKEQITDLWQLIGFYEVSAGTKLVMQTRIDIGGEAQTIAVDRVLILRLNEQSSKVIAQLPEGRKLMMILDDQTLNTVNNWGVKSEVTASNDGWNRFPIKDSWSGSAWVRKAGWQSQIITDWEPGVILAPGKYELNVWIPSEHATAKVSYTLTLNGSPLLKPTASDMEQKLSSFKWVSMGIWEVDKNGLVSVRLSANIDQPDNQREICADVVAILMVGD